jgi:hypothetical protein
MTEGEELSEQLRRLADEAALLREEELARLGAALDFVAVASDAVTSALHRPLANSRERMDHLGEEAARLGLTPTGDELLTRAESARRRLREEEAEWAREVAAVMRAWQEMTDLRDELARLRPRFDRARKTVDHAGGALDYAEALLAHVEAGGWFGKPRGPGDIPEWLAEQPELRAGRQSGSPDEADLTSGVRLHGEPLRPPPPDPPPSGGKGPQASE